MSDFYPWFKVSRQLNRFKDVHPEYYEIVETFAMDMLAKGLSEIRVSGYMSFLSRILKVVNKNPGSSPETGGVLEVTFTNFLV